MKKLVKSITVALTLALSLVFSATAAACSFGPKEYVPSGDEYFEFILNDEGTAYSVKAASVDNLPEAVKLPKEHDGKPVDSVAANGFKDAQIKEVYLPLNIKKVGASAFEKCENLNYLYFYKGQGLEEIGNAAFKGNVSLDFLDCPNSLRTVGINAFWGCTKLERVKLPEKVEIIGEYSFAYCTALTYFYVPTKTSDLGENAFLGVPNVEFEISKSNPYYGLYDGKPVRRAD